MLKVVLNEFTITNMLEIVYSLRAQGYKQGVDFDFTYTPEKFNNNNSFEEKIQERKLEFTFYDEQLGLVFKLQHGQ